MLDLCRIETLKLYLGEALKSDFEIWECGVYAGGSACALDSVLELLHRHNPLRLFDTFKGIALANAARDKHVDGEFSDTSVEAVRELFEGKPYVSIHQGVFPATFEPFKDSKICFAHIDCDVYASVKACIEFIWPRLSQGGILVFDDYFHPNCPGATQAVNEFLEAEFIKTKSGSLPATLFATIGAFPQIVVKKL